MSLLIELQYFPPVKSYSTLIKSTDIIFSLYENYQRRSFRNRCILSGANGLISLTVPIAGGRNQKEVFNEVRIDYSSNWQQQHWRTIFSAYGKSPWFFHYAESLEKLFSQKVDLLADWNRVCLDWVNDALGVDMKLLESGGTFGKWGDFWKVWAKDKKLIHFLTIWVVSPNRNLIPWIGGTGSCRQIFRTQTWGLSRFIPRFLKNDLVFSPI